MKKIIIILFVSLFVGFQSCSSVQYSTDSIYHTDDTYTETTQHITTNYFYHNYDWSLNTWRFRSIGFNYGYPLWSSWQGFHWNNYYYHQHPFNLRWGWGHLWTNPYWGYNGWNNYNDYWYNNPYPYGQRLWNYQYGLHLPYRNSYYGHRNSLYKKNENGTPTVKPVGNNSTTNPPVRNVNPVPYDQRNVNPKPIQERQIKQIIPSRQQPLPQRQYNQTPPVQHYNTQPRQQTPPTRQYKTQPPNRIQPTYNHQRR
jgi:hypothetical protein